MSQPSFNRVPCTRKMEVRTGNYDSQSQEEEAPRNTPAYVYSFPKYTDPLFRQMDARSMINGSTTCSLEILKGDTEHQGKKTSVAQTMIHLDKSRFQPSQFSGIVTESADEINQDNMHHTFRRGVNTYHSELNEETCSWEELEQAGVIFDAKYHPSHSTYAT
jgi:hypothetical protein